MRIVLAKDRTTVYCTAIYALQDGEMPLGRGVVSGDNDKSRPPLKRAAVDGSPLARN